MEKNNRPRAREKNDVGQGSSVKRRGSGTGNGPVGLGQNLNDRRPSGGSGQSAKRPGSGSTGAGGQRPGGSRPGGSSSRPGGGSYRPQTPFSSEGGGQRTGYSSGSSGRRSGGFNPILLIILAVILLGGGGGLSGLLGGGGGSDYTLNDTTLGSGQSGSYSSGTSGSASSGSSTGSSSGSTAGSSGSSYSSSGSQTSSSGGSVSVSDNRGRLNREVSPKARAKYTTLKGNGSDTTTILVYMCGTDLESRSGMGTSDLSEMTKADLGSNINLLVYTGGCRRWQNNIVSSSVNQIYQIRNGGLALLEDNMGNGSMTNPDTLASFLTWGKKNYPADRYDLILWDHGGGSLSGYGYDEKNSMSGSMSLASLSSALEKSGMKFDFIGFDACLMATVENASMLTKYADYMIASEEAEPGIGWYYTNWLTALSKDPSMSTLDIGKNIVDDFVATCQRQCRGQSATLSVVDLAELQNTLGAGLSSFSQDILTKIRSGEYKSVATARNNAREFAQSSAIDQIDFVDFANRCSTSQGNALCGVLLDAVKYNQTSSGINNAYGLSVYFPYKKMSNVSTAVKTYDALGMDDDFTDCIREFASLQLAGQSASQTSGLPTDSLFGNLFESMLGSGSYSGQTSGSTYSGGLSTSDLIDLFGMFMGGGSSGSSYDAFTSLADLAGLDTSFFGGRGFDAEAAASYVTENRFDPTSLVWTRNADGDPVISLTDDQWDLILSVEKNLLVDEGEGYADLGTDNLYTFDDDGNLVADTDVTWLSINNQIVSYQYLDTVEDEDGSYTIRGKVPAYLNSEQVNLILVFDSDNPNGYIAGAQPVYEEDVTETISKGLIDLVPGDKLDFLCDYYSYDGTFEDSYVFGDTMEVTDEMVIGDAHPEEQNAIILYRFSDIYNQHYWTEPLVP